MQKILPKYNRAYPNYKLISGVILCFFGFNLTLSGQYSYVIVQNIYIDGNVKTKENVILQELDFKPGDTIHIADLPNRMIKNEKRLSSIGLFTDVNYNIKNWDTESTTCDINFQVRENWFIYPYIIVEFADRNFNVWWREQNKALDRINYGVALNHINFSGNKDKLKLVFQTGYTQKYEVYYDYPYLWNNWGFSLNYLYSENKELAYITTNNKPVFARHPDRNKLFSLHRGSVALSKRFNAFTFNSISFEYFDLSIDNYVVRELNNEYFGKDRNRIKYGAITYAISYDKTLYPLYPMKGFRFDLQIRKEGLGIIKDINHLSIYAYGAIHSKLNKRFILSNSFTIKSQVIPNELPYHFNKSLGYNGDVLMGYDLYSIDGRGFFLQRNALKFMLLDMKFNMHRYFPKQFRVMDAKMFLRAQFDYGVSNDPKFFETNNYTNSIQLGYGPALDLLLFNNFFLSLEYGITRFGEKAVYIDSWVNF